MLEKGLTPVVFESKKTMSSDSSRAVECCLTSSMENTYIQNQLLGGLKQAKRITQNKTEIDLAGALMIYYLFLEYMGCSEEVIEKILKVDFGRAESVAEGKR